ncbi:MAG: VTT domain-containing protein [Emcibacteraceae bacterium]|nr:VTT domain-containing protein [Emcibacteraceae bacterium]
MKSLIKVILILGLVSGSSFILVQATGLITIDKINFWFNEIKLLPAYYIGGIIIFFMFIDLVISIPTLAIIMLAGFFLGTFLGALFTIIGLMIAGCCGYILGYKYGEVLLILLLRNVQERNEFKASFKKHGYVTILLSRALPVLPEISTCIAGMTKMPFSKFILAWFISITPYSIIAAYAGAASSPRSPEPAIIAWSLLTSTLWISWYFFKKTKKSCND